MPDYAPLDLGPFLNAGLRELGGSIDAELGSVLLRGIPFQIGPTTLPTDARSLSSATNLFTGFGEGLRVETLRIPVERHARTVIVAHVMLDSQVARNGPIGGRVADYAFELGDGSTVSTPVRELFEIGGLARPDLPAVEYRATRIQTWPFLAVPDRYEGMHPRRSGPWSLAGRRLEEVEPRTSEGFGLWVWRNPSDLPVRAMYVRAHGPRFIIAGVTVGSLDEDPFVRTGREAIRIELQGLPPSDEDLEVAVDRGVATYTWPLLVGRDAFLDEVIRGWGEPAGAASGHSYAEVAAVPSATIAISRSGAALGSVRWGDVLETGAAEDSGRLRIEWVDRTRTWVHTSVVDADSGLPVPCRIHFRSASGIPYAPHGHHAHVNGDMPSWHSDVGGDVRLGATTYAVIDGRCQGWLPEGEVLVEVNRGFEYEPLREAIVIRPGQRELRLEIRRWSDVRQDGWISGDTHVHFLSVDGGHLEAAAEDLDVVNLLQAQWGHLFTNREDFTGRPSVSPDWGTTVYVGQENRQHVLGHLGLLGLRQAIMPWSSDGPSEAELGGTLEATLSEWADAARAQGALVTLPHFGYPNGEAAALIATGRVDALEMIWLGEYFHKEYYRYLNAGYRLPLAAGTDKMTAEVPVGIYRTYVHLRPDEPPTFDNWAANLIRGRTFATAGPMLRFRVDGLESGDVVRLPRDGGTVEVEAVAESALPIQSLQLVAAGEVVAETVVAAGSRRLELSERVKITASTWLAVRAGGPRYYDARLTLCSFERGVFAHTSPVYVACGPGEWEMRDDATLEYMIARVEAARAYVREVAPVTRVGGGGHPHGNDDHLAHLERPFLEALRALRSRGG